MPLRDDRRGRRATISWGKTPLRPEFHATSGTEPEAGVGQSRRATEEDVRSDDACSHLDLTFSALLARDDDRASLSTPVEAPNSTPEAPAPQKAPATEAPPTAAAPSIIASLSPSVATTAVLDPFAFLTALAQPLFAAKDAYVRFVSGSTAAGASLDPEPPEVDTGAEAGSDADALTCIEREASVIERSFASEFAALIGHPPSPEFGETDANAAPLGPTSTSSYDAETAGTVDAPAATSAGERFPQSRHDDALVDASPPTPETNAHRIVLRSSSPLVERAVPLTRLPLRPQGSEITWTQETAALDLDATRSRTQRHALLERSVRDADKLPYAILDRAYREEDLEGRTIALRALSLHYAGEAKSIFVEALRLGSDDERALAIDGLTSTGARAELVPAFGDRVDAVAAKAALAYVGSRSRSEYRAELTAHVDAAQIERILTLLAGIIE